MAYMIPIIANKKNYRRSNSGGVIAGLIIFLVFGVIFFLFFNRTGMFRFNFSIIFWIGGIMIFIAIVLAASAVMMSKPHSSINRNIYRQQNVLEKSEEYTNPYKTPGIDINKKEVLKKEIINYCRYCGARKDKEAIFCHMCGTKY
jgi:hypothetical protein